MSRFLAFASPPPGHLFPFVPTLAELARREHRVVVTVAPESVELVEAQGLTAAVFPERLLRPPEEATARTPLGAYKQGLRLLPRTRR